MLFCESFSTKLNEQLKRLCEKGAHLFSDAIMNRVQTSIEFVEKLDQDLAKATDIKEINVQARIYTINIIPFIQRCKPDKIFYGGLKVRGD